MLVEDGGHGLDGFEEGPDLLELVAVEHLRGLGGVVEVAAEDVPAGEDEVVELGDGNEVLDERAASSVRLPRRMVPICVSEPMGLAMPWRTASTPAMSVVQTAPIPGIMIPSFPVAGLMLAALCGAAGWFDIPCYPSELVLYFTAWPACDLEPFDGGFHSSLAHVIGCL